MILFIILIIFPWNCHRRPPFLPFFSERTKERMIGKKLKQIEEEILKRWRDASSAEARPSYWFFLWGPSPPDRSLKPPMRYFSLFYVFEFCETVAFMEERSAAVAFFIRSVQVIPLIFEIRHEIDLLISNKISCDIGQWFSKSPHCSCTLRTNRVIG